MIPYARLIFAVSTYSLDELPKGCGSALAGDYQIAWTSLWDPRLLAHFQALPEWKRSDSNALDIEDALIVCPDLAHAKIDQPLEERLRLGRNHLVPSARRQRREVVQSILQAIDERIAEAARESSSEGMNSSSTTASLTGTSSESLPGLQDFYALGYTFLQIQTMARRLRYSFNLDLLSFAEQVLSAAKASIAGDAEETERWLTASFDALSQERDRYCSQQGNLLELVLTAPSTVGKSLAVQLASDRPMTLYATSETLRAIREQNQDAWHQITTRLEANTLALAGGLQTERPHATMTEGALRREFAAGQADCESLGIPPPKTWMRFTPSIPTSFPNLARYFGFQGAILAALGGGSVPKKDHAKIRWQGAGDRGGIDCILGHVLDVSDAETTLSLGQQMAEQLDYHQVPTLVLAHWPGYQSEVFSDLMHSTRRTPALGKWIHTSDYFANTAQPYWTEHYSAIDFWGQIPNTTADIHAMHVQMGRQLKTLHRLEHLRSLAQLWSLVPRKATQSGGDSINPIIESLERMIASIDNSAVASSGDIVSELETPLEHLERELLDELRVRSACNSPKVAFNPTSHPLRLHLRDQVGGLASSLASRAVATSSEGTVHQLIVDVPAHGFFPMEILPTGQGTDAISPAKPSSVSAKTPWLGRIFGGRSAVAQEDGSLANEFMELQIDPEKGYLKSLYFVNQRGNRLSAQLSIAPQPLSLKGKWDSEPFVSLSNVQMKVRHACKVRGTIEVTGAALGSRWTLEYTLWQGARWLDVAIRGEGINFQECFPIWRMVWPSEAATIAAWQQGTRSKLPAPLQSAVELIEIDDVDHKIHFAPCGLNMHRRLGHNGLGSVLPVDQGGRSACSFALGMDWTRPWETAVGCLIPPLVASHAPQSTTATPQSSDTATGAWLAQCNQPNLHLMWCEPVSGGKLSNPSVPSPQPGLDQTNDADSMAKEAAGIADESTLRCDAGIWITETSGRAGTARIACMKPITCAWRVDSRGIVYDTVRVEDGVAVLAYQSNERAYVALQFQK